MNKPLTHQYCEYTDDRCEHSCPVGGFCALVGNRLGNLSQSPSTDTVALRDWWVKQAAAEADKLAPKAVEYGAYDLEMLGGMLGDMAGRPPSVELGLVFYLAGKIARAVSAVKDGRQASDDTFLDIAIYARMVLYVREHGRWP